MDHFNYRVASLDHRIGRPPLLINSRDLVSGGYRFCSIYGVRQEDAEAIMAAGSAAGFKGLCWSRRLWLDYDSYEAAEQAERYLKHENLNTVVYDTGGRGRHLGILRDARPSHLLPSQDKQWAAEHARGCDMSIFWHLHLLRLPGAVHERTGRRKTLVGRYGDRPLILPPYVPQESVSSLPPAGDGGQRPSIFSNWDVASRLQPERGAPRQQHLVQLALALKNDAGVNVDEALWVALEVNRGFEVPKERSEVLRIVKWAWGLE